MNQTMNCDCGYESAAGTEYRSLPIIIEGYNSLPPAIQNFFRPEKFVSHLARHSFSFHLFLLHLSVADYKCSKCGRVGYMIKAVNFDALPQVLIIQLNRYIYDKFVQFKLFKSRCDNCWNSSAPKDAIAS
jgi:ubiquitin C-terminal hydrolase